MKYIPQGISRKLGDAILTQKKHAPRTMFVLGLAGTITSAVLACRATLKLPDMIDEMESDIREVKAARDSLQHFNQGSRTPAVTDKDVAYAYAINAMRVTKLYAPSVVLGVASIGLLTSSHVTLTRRNAGLTAAYATLQTAFESYRERVREQVGEEKEKDLYRGITEETIEEDGKVKKVKTVNPNGLSAYSKLFDESNRNYKPFIDHNRTFLLGVQNYMNHVLNSRGHVFLNEVYEELGFPHTPAGQVVGWKFDNPRGGDNFIDFGLFEARNSDFSNGYERSIWLDFNVDGNMFDLIG